MRVYYTCIYLSLACTQGENILMVELDMPNRTTRDYMGPEIAPKIQAALDAALQDEEDIDVDGRSVINDVSDESSTVLSHR